MPGFMTRSAAAVVLLAGLSLTLAGATHAKTLATGGCAPAGGTSQRQAAAVRAQHPDRRDGLVRVAEPRRPERRREARDRRPVLLDLRLRREGAPAREGHRDEGPRLRARRRRRPRRRQDPRDRRRRQRRHGRRLRLRRREAAAQARLAGVDVQRGPVPGGSRHGSGRPRRRRPHRGRRHDDQHLTDRVAGVRLRRERPPLAPEGSAGDLVAALQPTDRRRKRRQVQRRRQPRLRRLRRERRRSGTSTTTRSSRSSSPSTTTRSTSSTTTARRCSPRRGSPTASPATRAGGSAGGSSSAGSSPTVENNQYHRHVGPWPDVRKTPWLQWTASPPVVADLDGDGKNEVIGLPNVERERAVRDAGLRVHGPRRRPERRRALGDAPRGLRQAAAVVEAGVSPGRRLVSRRAGSPRPPS